MLKPYLLRRVKANVLKALPPKTETIIDIELTFVQKKYYRAVIDRNFSILNKSGAGNGLRNVSMELRKLCLHPFLLKGSEETEVGLLSHSFSLDPHCMLLL